MQCKMRRALHSRECWIVVSTERFGSDIAESGGLTRTNVFYIVKHENKRG